jgi:hypothetical protein
MTQDIQAARCAACQAANLPGVKFCAECGAPLATAASRATAHSAAPVAASAAQSVAQSGVSSVASPVAVPADPMAHVRNALTRANAAVSGGDGQTTLEYTMVYSDKVLGPTKLQFAGTVTSGPQGQTVTARMMPKSMAMLFGSFAVGCVVLGFLPRALVSNETFVGTVAICLAATAWLIFAEAPKRVRRQLEGLIGEAGTTSPVAVSTPAFVPVTSKAVADDSAFAQLERLAQLQATGLLTADEVAAKKAELLQRI